MPEEVGAVVASVSVSVSVTKPMVIRYEERVECLSYLTNVNTVPGQRNTTLAMARPL